MSKWGGMNACLHINFTDSDLMLINLVRETLSKAGWSEQLLTGKTAWDVGNGTRNAIDPPRYQFENGDTTQKVLGYNKL